MNWISVIIEPSLAVSVCNSETLEGSATKSGNDLNLDSRRLTE